MTISASFDGVMINNPIPNPLKLATWHQILFLGKGWTGGVTPASSTSGAPGFTFHVDVLFPTMQLPTKLSGTIDITGGPGISFGIIASVDAAGNITGKLTAASTWNGQKITGSVVGSFTKAGSITITSTDSVAISPAHLLQPITGNVNLTTGQASPKKNLPGKTEAPLKSKKPKKRKAPKKKKRDD